MGLPMRRIAVAVLAGAAVLVLVVVLVGYALPVGHVATVERDFAAAPDVVYAAIADVAAYPSWRSDVERIEMLGESPQRWREHGSNGVITFVVDTEAAPNRRVTRIDDPSLPFGGTWTFELIPRPDGGCRLAITERGEVFNPLFRFFSRFVFGHTATLETFATNLDRHLRPPS